MNVNHLIFMLVYLQSTLPNVSKYDMPGFILLSPRERIKINLQRYMIAHASLPSTQRNENETKQRGREEERMYLRSATAFLPFIKFNRRSLGIRLTNTRLLYRHTLSLYTLYLIIKYFIYLYKQVSTFVSSRRILKTNE